MDTYVKVHPKYMVVIPKEVREQAHIGLGDKLIARFRKGEVVLTPIRSSSAKERVAAIEALSKMHPSNIKVPDERIFDPMGHLDAEDIENL